MVDPSVKSEALFYASIAMLAKYAGRPNQLTAEEFADTAVLIARAYEEYLLEEEENDKT